MSVGRHTLYNLAGSIFPMAVSIICVPVYLHLVGDTRYGVLSIVWLFMGYFGLFDPGLSRAAAYHIARLQDGAAKEREDVFWTAMIVNLGFGLIGGLVCYLIAHPIFASVFKMPDEMRAEIMCSLPWLAASIPFSILGAALGGVLQAREWFGAFNTINAFNMSLSQIVPLIVAYFHGPDLTWLIPAILLARLAGALPTCIAVKKCMNLPAGGGFRISLLRPLFSYGGWITVSNLINPLLTTMDRMLIGSITGAEAVAYYSVPFNLVSRVSVIPGALSSSLFPKLSRGSRDDSGRLAAEAVMGLAAIMTPLIAGGIIALPVFMNLWVGDAFAAHAIPVGTVLFLGIWVNGLAYIPYGQLQAANRPDLTAKFHALELVPFLAVLWLGLHYFGLIGAAWAWTLRVTLDALLLFMAAGRLQLWRKLWPGALMVLAATLCAPAKLQSYQTCFAIFLLLVAIGWSWHVSPTLRRALGTVKCRLATLRV